MSDVKARVEVRDVKSTNVRAKGSDERFRGPWWFGGLRGGFAVLQRVAPPLAAVAADELFFTPGAGRPVGGEILARGARRVVETPAGRVVAWSWGQGPRVYLVHGWGGRAGDFAALVPALTEAGFSVVAFDAPAHGASPGRLSSAPQFAHALRGVVAAFGPAHAVVAHSLGSLATAHALLTGLSVDRVVLLGATAGPRRWVLRFARTFGLDAATVRRARQRSERRLGLPWAELAVASRVPALAAPALFFHDRDDREVPWSESARLAAAWPGAELVTTSGLGHRRILKDPSVARRMIAFLGEGRTVAPAVADGCGHASASPAGWCGACALERELFVPETRRARAFPA